MVVNLLLWIYNLLRLNPGSFTENDKFGMKLEYNTVTSPAVAKYNGNIASFTWGTLNLTNARYVYTYDNNNRLTNANYTATANSYALDETFTYDANGNITAVNRYNYSGTYIDRLVFTYSGNRVTGLKDNAGDNAYVIDYPGTYNSLPYIYDYNGNVTNEPHKQIGIGYNMLNLPYLINWNGLNRKINYFYTFNGEKLRKTVEDNGTITKVDYCGPFVYETTSGTRSLKYIATPYGRAVKNGSAWVYEYNLTDHLGNVRVVIKKGTNNLAEIVQQKGYYSFGMEISQFSAGTGTSKNWYNGKEIQDDFGLYWYDYGARFYDPMLGRWHTPDPLAEKWRRMSPYNYAANNPMRFIDPDGMEMTDFKDKLDNLVARVKDGSNAVFKLTGDNKTNEYFEFTGEYSNQGGKNEVSVEGAIAGAQDYVTNNYDKCNQSVNFVGRTFESATEAQGKTVDNIEIVNGNSFAKGITNDLANKIAAEKSVASAQESAANGNLVVGANGRHVVTMTTKTFDITRFDATGKVVENKQIGGGKIANVNGSVQPFNIGPGKINSFQNPKYSQTDLIWYSLPRK